MGRATREQRDRWIARNPEKNRQSKKKWKTENRESVSSYGRRYKQRKDVKERAREASRKYRERIGHVVLIRSAKHRSQKRGIAFELDEAWKSGVSHCELTGIPFVQRDKLFAASIDRIDNSKGYTPDNCRLILNGLNLFKNSGTDEDMLRIARALVEKVGG